MKRKKWFSITGLFFVILLTACDNNAQQKTNTGQPIINFVTKEFDFGIINEGEKVQYKFKFVNSGNGDLVIRSAEASCGCTVPKFSDKPIRPGEEGEIEVEFNSEGKPGAAAKTITVRSNTNPEVTTLTIKGEVIPKAKK
ncbi:MAG: DUF1573 domain-containing protein [Bacteroidia bacterium]|nr:DUF1573 domain-containing protein [Bacteroidia bacterium]MDW8347705.1 DUF1573 domain-containing protein [Bacteroidia bacterium]